MTTGSAPDLDQLDPREVLALRLRHVNHTEERALDLMAMRHPHGMPQVPHMGRIGRVGWMLHPVVLVEVHDRP